MFIGELSVLDNSPFPHFDEEFCKWHISNHNLIRESGNPVLQGMESRVIMDL